MLEREKREKILEESEEVEREYDTMYYPQVDGITPTVVAESCDDCISRQAVLERREILKDKQGTGYQAVKTKYIRELPSVNPQPKTGHWIVHEIESTLRWLECSNCHCETSYNVMHNYCPNCGCAMKGELE